MPEGTISLKRPAVCVYGPDTAVGQSVNETACLRQTQKGGR